MNHLTPTEARDVLLDNLPIPHGQSEAVAVYELVESIAHSMQYDRVLGDEYLEVIVSSMGEVEAVARLVAKAAQDLLDSREKTV